MSITQPVNVSRVERAGTNIHNPKQGGEANILSVQKKKKKKECNLKEIRAKFILLVSIDGH